MWDCGKVLPKKKKKCSEEGLVGNTGDLKFKIR